MQGKQRLRPSEGCARLISRITQADQDFHAALADDFNTPQALKVRVRYKGGAELVSLTHTHTLSLSLSLLHSLARSFALQRAGGMQAMHAIVSDANSLVSSGDAGFTIFAQGPRSTSCQ